MRNRRKIIIDLVFTAIVHIITFAALIYLALHTNLG